MIKKTFFPFFIFFSTVTLSCADKHIPVIHSGVENSLRAPAYPLVTSDTYFSCWSYADKLYDDQPRHWTGKEFPLTGAIRVDGKVYRFMGKENMPMIPILPTSSATNWEGLYTFEQPRKGDWKSANYNDNSWKKGFAAFGTEGEPNLSTPWQTKDIWVRRVFDLNEEGIADKNIYLNYSHDDIFELYINGIQVVSTGYDWKYNVMLELTGEAKSALKKGKNVIAAHCHNVTGGAYVDFGLYEKQADNELFARTAVQKSANILPTQTFYTFECGPVELEVVFTAPLLPDNLELLARPVNYLTYQVKSTDNVSHDVQVYIDATPQWAVDTDGQPVSIEAAREGELTFLKSGTIEQPVLQKQGDDRRIDWGYFYMAGKTGETVGMNFDEYQAPKKEFSANGRISSAHVPSYKGKMTGGMPVMAYSHDMGKVSSETASGYLMLGYDDIYSIQYFGKNLKGYWKNANTPDIIRAFECADKDYASIMRQCDKFNRKMMTETADVGGDKYAGLCALAYRQSVSAHKLVKDENGDLLFFSKENDSNGSIGTVDITYPSSPLFLLYNTELLKGMLNFIFYYSESGKWTKPFAAHDVGTYPLANGQTYGGDMPVEESGNMLILTAAIATIEKNADYAAKHWDVLTTWTDYLVREGLDPANQLCTDDFAGHFAHNANLSVKAIMGIASYGKLAAMLGKREVSEKYTDIARKMAAEWERMANDGNHYRLTFDKPGTWSQKYNLVWDKLLGFNIFDPQIAKKEIAYYLTKQNEFGLPLDSRRTYTKSDWIIWTATMADNSDNFQDFIDLVYKYADETTTRVPLSDWHETTDGKRVGFKARSVVGGYFMKMLERKLKD